MKTIALISVALATTALAQPHGRHGHLHAHKKRHMATDWVTEYETVTVTKYIDQTTTEYITPGAEKPAKYTTSTVSTDGQFYEGSKHTPAPSPEETYKAAPPPPPPSTSVYKAPPVETPEYKPSPTVAYTPAAAPTNADKSAGESRASATYSGDMTYYDLGLGACGLNDGGKDETDNIVAISHIDMGELSNSNPMCGKRITITAGGKSCEAVVHDKCMGCKSGEIDVSRKIFKELMGGLDAGRTVVSWSWQ